MRHEVAAAVGPEARLNAAGVAYVAFATSNPGLFKLMFGSNVYLSSGDPDLDAARIRPRGTAWGRACCSGVGLSTSRRLWKSRA